MLSWLKPLCRTMADVFPREKRSEIMAAVRSKGNKSTELRLVSLFRKNKISGWRRHLNLPGNPDFAFRKEKVVVFVDGCFWHGCPNCYREPKSRRAYWREKIVKNQRRDRQVSSRLRSLGWSVIRVKECSLRKWPVATGERIRKMVISRRESYK